MQSGYISAPVITGPMTQWQEMFTVQGSTCKWSEGICGMQSGYLSAPVITGSMTQWWEMFTIQEATCKWGNLWYAVWLYKCSNDHWSNDPMTGDIYCSRVNMQMREFVVCCLVIFLGYLASKRTLGDLILTYELVVRRRLRTFGFFQANCLMLFWPLNGHRGQIWPCHWLCLGPKPLLTIF